MEAMHNTQVTPISEAGSSARVSPLARLMLQVLAGVAMVTLGAQVRVPVPGTAVPMTLQMVGVLAAGLLFPPRAAIAAMVCYLACGTAGLPVFRVGSLGLSGITGGYLVGFVLAAGFSSYLFRRLPGGFVSAILASACGAALILSSGVLWMMFGLGSFILAVQTGLLPFIPKAAIEVVLVATLVHGAGKLRRGADPKLRGEV